MHCPNCGKKTNTEHKFCRSCGLPLEKVAQILAEQLPASVSDESLKSKWLEAAGIRCYLEP
jgi:predicted amidophosphoribosyltransferase